MKKICAAIITDYFNVHDLPNCLAVIDTIGGTDGAAIMMANIDSRKRTTKILLAKLLLV